MAYQGIAKVQHYVPQFLLRHFGTGKKDYLYVLDKQSGRTFRTSSRNVAAESRFYDFDFEGKKLTLEPSLSHIESVGKRLLQKILDADSLTAISTEERAQLSVFFAIQFLRTRAFKEQWRSMPKLLGEHLRQFHTDDELAGIAEHLKVPDENQTTVDVVRFMARAREEFATHFAHKVWVLLKADPKTPFIIGDHPIGLQNSQDHSPYGNIGLAVPGIEIYFPISPSRALAMWCLSFLKTFGEGVQQMRMLSRIAPYDINAHVRDPAGIEQTWEAMTAGSPLRYNAEHVVNFNSLQIKYSERYVFSSAGDFALAQRMLSEHPHMRTGPRMTIG